MALLWDALVATTRAKHAGFNNISLYWFGFFELFFKYWLYTITKYGCIQNTILLNSEKSGQNLWDMLISTFLLDDNDFAHINKLCFFNKSKWSFKCLNTPFFEYIRIKKLKTFQNISIVNFPARWGFCSIQAIFSSSKATSFDYYNVTSSQQHSASWDLQLIHTERHTSTYTCMKQKRN